LYLLDSNTFIEAKNRYYGFDICPGFWQWMDANSPAGEVKSITMVYEELADGNDELADWIKTRKDDGRFLDISDPLTQEVFSNIAAMVQSGPYKLAGITHFLNKADPWLIAKAKTTGGTVVTDEVSAPDSIRSVKIPDVCVAFGVPYINTFDLLRTETAAFGLMD